MEENTLTVKTDFSEVYAKKAWLQKYVERKVLALVNATSLSLQKYIRTDLFVPYMAGRKSSEGSLQTRSGKLKKSIIVVKAELTNGGETVKGGISIGTVYGRIHFGKRGQPPKEIVPKNKQWLTVPLQGAMTSHGVPRGSAIDESIFGKTFVAKSKKGNLIIFGKLKCVRGKRAGQTKGDILPLFVLKKSVKVPISITSEDLHDYMRPIIGKGLADIRDGIERSTAFTVLEA